MKVSIDGKIEDPKLEESKKIIECIYNILYMEWFPFMKEHFTGEYFEFFSIAIFLWFLLGNPTEKELMDMLYEKETEFSFADASRSRCYKITFQLLSLRPWVERNKVMTDDPFHG